MTRTVLELIKVVIIIKVRRINRIKDIIENDQEDVDKSDFNFCSQNSV